ncbi:MAG: ATP-binding cassette domain-containing protein, partial [Leptospiraceae bacterium]|nr:ATP-binding cassette domain-containing protein [Leptospiraceae bacterium]
MDKPDRQKSKNLRSLGFAFGFVKAYRLRTALAIFALLITSAATLSLGFGLRWIVDQGIATESIEALNEAILVFMAMALLLALGTFVRHYFVSWLGERVSSDIRIAVFNRVIDLHPSYFETNVTGEIQTRITTDTSILQSFIGSSGSIAARNLLMLIGGVALLLYTRFELTGLVLICLPLALGPVLILGRKVRAKSRQSQDRLAAVGAFVGETLRGIKTVQANNHQVHDKKMFAAHVETAFAAVRSVIHYRSLLIVIAILFSLGALAVLFRVAGAQLIANESQPGELFQFAFYAFMVASAIGQLSEVLGDMQKAAGATERLAELYYAQSLIAPPDNPQALPDPVQGDLRIEQLRFVYATRPKNPAIKEISVHIEPGRTVALVGPSGAGKSTLFDLLLRFYDPQSGSILLDNTDIRHIDPAELRRHVGIVPQEPMLFSATLLENIRYARPTADLYEIERAIDQACVADFVAELPQGLDSHLGESGIRLSGGQKQRVAIARAILKDPQLLLLDEATSA